jgi:hypothetical protein
MKKLRQRKGGEEERIDKYKDRELLQQRKTDLPY